MRRVADSTFVWTATRSRRTIPQQLTGFARKPNVYGATLASPFVQPFDERYGLEPASVTLSATLHV